MFQLKTIQQKQHLPFQRISGKLKAGLNLENLQKHLKLQYGLGCKFSYINSKTSTQRKKNELELLDSTKVKDIIQYYSLLGINLEIFNEHAQSIPVDLTLSEASVYSFSADEEYNFNSLISSLDSISTNANYADIEWIKRIFMQALRKGKDEEKREIIKAKLEQIFSSNERFLQSDYEEILKHF